MWKMRVHINLSLKWLWISKKWSSKINLKDLSKTLKNHENNHQFFSSILVRSKDYGRRLDFGPWKIPLKMLEILAKENLKMDFTPDLKEK